MVTSYKVDAIRLDTAPYMPKAFLSAFQRTATVDILGEVTSSNLSFHASYQEDRDADTVLRGLLNFPLTYQIPAAFCGTQAQQLSSTPFDMSALGEVLMRQQQPGAYANLDLLGNFADNHDGPRIARQCANDTTRVAHALAFVMLTRGVPIVYYGTEHSFAQDDNRVAMWPTRFARGGAIYTLLARLNSIRRAHGVGQHGLPVALVHASASQLVLSRGDVWIYLNNVGDAAARTPLAYCGGGASIVPPLPPDGRVWVDTLSDDAAAARFNASCFLAIDGAPKVLVLRARVEGLKTE